MSEQGTVDIHGKAVRVGTCVRVLAIDESVLANLDSMARARVLSMLSQSLPVYEVDPYGRAWVEQWWREDANHSTSHSLALEPHHMEVCQ